MILLPVSIQEGIQSVFIVSYFLLITLDDITVALIDNLTCGTHSVFESHSRDVAGNPTPVEQLYCLPLIRLKT